VVGWDVLVLMCRGDNLKVIIIKLNKEHKKYIPEVETHMCYERYFSSFLLL
jgi:hypothetical protein